MIRRVVRIYEQVETSPQYETAVQLLHSYRSTAARMGSARIKTQGKLDRQLEKLQETANEILGECTENDRQALDCIKYDEDLSVWEIDHHVLMEKPYRSVRKVERYDEPVGSGAEMADRSAEMKKAIEANGGRATLAILRQFG